MRGHMDDFLVPEQDAAAIGSGKPGQNHQQRCLAGSRRSQQGQELTLFDIQIDRIQGFCAAIGFGHATDRNGQRFSVLIGHTRTPFRRNDG